MPQKRKTESSPQAEPIPATTLHYRMPHPGQAVILNHPARFRVVACGRRFGKTELAKLDAIITARDGGVAWWVLPTYTMAQDVWADLSQLLEPLDGIHIAKGSKTIFFAEGGEITVKSGHEPDHLRGSGLDSVVIDEAAFCHEDVWYALRPALSDRMGKALLLSTPRGRNWFWRLYQKGVDPLEPEWVSWRMPTAANPFIPRSEIEAARQDMPERQFTEEYEAGFLANANTVFRDVRRCIVSTPKRVNEPICFGVDWGRVNDFTAIVVMGMASRQVLAIDRFNQVKWSVQRKRLIKLAKSWNPKIILAEANSIGDPNIEILKSEGLPIQPFTTTSSSKTPLIDALTAAIENQEIHLLNDPILIHELESYELERLPGGDFRFGAPPGGHDDTVIALALALHAAQLPRACVREYA